MTKKSAKVDQDNLRDSQGGSNSQDWKTLDLSKVFAMDLTAAISLLSIIRDTPEVYDGVLGTIEKYRENMILKEERQKELDRLEEEKKSKGEVLKPVN